MAQLLALEWDSSEARAVVARRRGRSLVVDHAFSISLTPRDPDQTAADVDVGERVRAALSARGVARPETLVAVGRANIELRLLSLPPTPDAELPGLVRFQAMRQFTALGDSWPLDYFPIDEPAEGARGVLAAAVSPDLVERIRQTCAVAGLRPKRLVLRSCAAASLLRHSRREGGDRVQLIVDLLADEADLTVLVEQTVVFMRTVRLPGQTAGEKSSALIGEIRRTVAAVQNQLGGRRVERFVIFGNSDGDDHADVKAALQRDLDLPADLFDPFSALSLSSELILHPPDHPGRFAPLLGMLLDEASGARHAIDFLHPRQVAKPVSPLRTLALPAAAAAVVVLAVAFFLWWRLAALDDQIDRMTKDVAAAEKQIKAASQLDAWAAGDVTWLDELRELSIEFPPPEEARVNQIGFAAVGVNGGGGGKIVLDVYAVEPSGIEPMDRALSDEAHQAYSGRVHEHDRDPKYPWQFPETIIVERQSKEAYRERDALRVKSSSDTAPSPQDPVATNLSK